MAIGKIAKNYKDLERLYPIKRRIRSIVRDTAIFVLSARSNIDSSKEWIRIPYYHHVFDDERSDFERHLRYLKNYGDFISLDTVVDIFKEKKIGGCYFCVTFDDGFKNCVSNALPILVENECPAAFFIPTDCIGSDIGKDSETIRSFFSTATDYPMPIDFLDWDDCRKLLEAGMTIGSHTCSHVPLSRLNNDQLRSELLRSKQKIEKELAIDCLHFAPPWETSGNTFGTAAYLIVVKETGYRSLLTTERGPNYNGTSPFKIRRDNVTAKWGNYQLRYFFSKRF